MGEGSIKFNPVWTKANSLPISELDELKTYRQRLYELNLIGVYDNGIGYGNISKRYVERQNQFIITGSTTGKINKLSTEHFTLVQEVDIDKNTLYCKGPIVASSESMSHAVIYQTLPWVHVVMHIHHAAMWKQLLYQVPTTNALAAYGTPEMAYSIIDLIHDTDLPEKKVFVMEGHEEGVFSFGKDFNEALDVLYQYIEVV